MYKVFLVDDEEVIVNQVAHVVPWLDNGFEVAGLETNSKKALDKVISTKPDVVFLDLKMPFIDGHSLMKKVRDAGLETEFVMLSAYGTFEDAKIFFKQDGFDYLLKPIQLDEVQLVLEKLAVKLAKKYPVQLETRNENMNPAFLKLIEYIQENYQEKFTLHSLAKEFGLSTGYICNLFAKYYNTTLTCFVTDIRLKRAVELINDGKLTLKQIASESGYSDYFYFNKVFKAHFGVAPSQYKKED